MTANPDQTINLLGIPGSLRQDSTNLSLLEAAAELTPPGVNLTVYRHLGEIPPFNEDLEEEAPVGVTRLRRALRGVDGVLIATPEYNQSIPGVLKNVIDWISRSNPAEGIDGKPVAVVGATTGPWGTRLAQTQLRQILVSCQALLLPSPALYVRNSGALFNESGSLIDKDTRSQLGNVLGALGDWTRLVDPSPQIDILARAG